MNVRRIAAEGFTLVETMVAIVLVVMAIGLALTGFLYAVKSESIITVQNELDLDTQKAMERLKRDLRLSSLDNMFFYPPGSVEFEAISFPMAEERDADGLVKVDANSKIIWDRQIIYHVKRSTPDELRITTITSRKDLSATVRQDQLNWIVEHGDGDGFNYPAGSNEVSSTFTVFRNLVEFKIRPQAARFDGYAPYVSRDTVNLGTYILLSPGSHDFTFSIIGKNTLSSGYKVGIDSMYISPSYSIREGEAQTVVSNSVSVQPTEILTGSWSGNYHLYTPGASNATFTLRMFNDAWEEMNFQDSTITHDGTLTKYDSDITPRDFILQLQGSGTNWQAVRQASTNTLALASSNALSGAAVRVLCRGRDMLDGGWIEASGSKSRFCFRAGSAGGLYISRASVVECESDLTPSMNASNTPVPLVFATGAERNIDPGDSTWSEWANFPIDASKSYLVAYSVRNTAGSGCAQAWAGSGTTPSSYVIPNGGSVPVDQGNWSAYTNVIATNAVLGLEFAQCSFLSNGVFTSQIMDTRVASPNYTAWNGSAQLNGGTVSIMHRTSSDDSMSGAVWTNATSLAEPTSSDTLSHLAKQRYIQFQLQLNASSTRTDPADPNSIYQSTPKVKSVITQWQGETNVVLVGGTFTKGPDYGIFRLTVDGRELKSGLQLDLSLYKTIRGFSRTGSQRIESFLTAEVMPRNTGR